MQWRNKWDLEALFAPIVRVKLVENILGFSASFTLPCNRDHKLKNKTKQNKMFHLCDAYSTESFPNIFDFQSPCNKVGFVIRNDEMPTLGKKMAPFMKRSVGCNISEKESL